jgi:BMFP domain-containing protein YqiC
MNSTQFLDELDNRIRQLLAQTPAADLQKNLKALLAQQFAQLDLATRAEFDVQSRVLARLTAEVEVLEKRVAELEARGKPAAPPS